MYLFNQLGYIKKKPVCPDVLTFKSRLKTTPLPRHMRHEYTIAYTESTIIDRSWLLTAKSMFPSNFGIHVCNV